MKLSLYTFVKDGLYLDFHVVEMLKHHLPLADEIIVDEGYSSDGTFEAISTIDSKIRVFRNEWDRTDPKTWSIKYRNRARQQCTGDWCIMLDADEFIPEWEFRNIRDTLSRTDKSIIAMNYMNFYGNYKIYNANPLKFGWPKWKFAIHRNLPLIEAWGDGANVRHQQQHDINDRSIYGEAFLTVHHFGTVRHAARLRQKWRHQSLRNRHGSNKKPKWDRTPGVVFDLMPHKWDDPDFMEDLTIYDGPFVEAVNKNPDEFVRDEFVLYNLLKTKHHVSDPE